MERLLATVAGAHPEKLVYLKATEDGALIISGHFDVQVPSTTPVQDKWDLYKICNVEDINDGRKYLQKSDVARRELSFRHSAQQHSCRS